MTAASRGSRASVRTRQLFTRILLTVGLIAPGALLFVQFRGSVDDRLATATRERLGVEYLRALQPLSVALGAAQSAAIDGVSETAEARRTEVQERVADVSEVDSRIGGQLGVRERWTNLRTRVEVLPRVGEPADLYTQHVDVMDLLAALIDRVSQLSGLAVDAHPDAYHLQQAITEDLPTLTISIGRMADLAALSLATTPRAQDLAELIALRDVAVRAAARLGENIETAASTSSDTTLVPNVFVALDTVRGDLDLLSSAGRAVTDGDVTQVDVQVVATLRENLTRAVSALSTSISDQLTAQLSARIAGAERDRLAAIVAIGVLAALGLVPTIAGFVDLVRFQREMRRLDRFEAEEAEALPAIEGRRTDQRRTDPQWGRPPTHAGRERAGAAQ